MTGINISSNTRGLGGALTNPTLLSKKKGNVQQDYPVRFRGEVYPDAETAYWAYAGGQPFDWQQQVCAEIVEAKLRQYPALLDAITTRGGVAWLETCWHSTSARTAAFARWEGTGRDSAFIRALVVAYTAVLTAPTVAEPIRATLPAPAAAPIKTAAPRKPRAERLPFPEALQVAFQRISGEATETSRAGPPRAAAGTGYPATPRFKNRRERRAALGLTQAA